MEQASIPTAAEYGSVDWIPEGNAHGCGKGRAARGFGSGSLIRGGRRAGPASNSMPLGAMGCAALFSWVRLGARLCLAGVANRQTNLTFQGAGARALAVT